MTKLHDKISQKDCSFNLRLRWKEYKVNEMVTVLIGPLKYLVLLFLLKKTKMKVRSKKKTNKDHSFVFNLSDVWKWSKKKNLSIWLLNWKSNEELFPFLFSACVLLFYTWGNYQRKKNEKKTFLKPIFAILWKWREKWRVVHQNGRFSKMCARQDSTIHTFSYCLFVKTSNVLSREFGKTKDHILHSHTVY